MRSAGTDLGERTAGARWVAGALIGVALVGTVTLGATTATATQRTLTAAVPLADGPTAAAIPVADPGQTPAPVPTPSVSDSTQPSPTPTASAPSTEPTTTSGPGTATPTSTASSGNSPSAVPPSPSVPPTEEPHTVPPTSRPGTVPAAQQSGVSVATGALAAAALVAAGLVLLLLRRSSDEPTPRPSPPPVEDIPPGTTALVVELGEAMIDAGYAVTEVQDTMLRVLHANGAPDGEVIVFPTAIFVSVPGQVTVETAVAAAGLTALRLDQVDAVSRLATAAEGGQLTPSQGLSALGELMDMTPPFGPTARFLGYGALSTGLALILRGSAADLVVAAVLGLLVGGLLMRARTASATMRAVLPLASAFFVATVVLALGRTDVDIGVLAPVVAPLVMFLPGALLTTAGIELATGQLISGGGRLAGGLMQLVLLSLGIVAGAELVGVPAASVSTIAAHPLGDLAPWLGVAVFGIGVAVFQCATRSSIGWILLVLYVAYGAQVIGGVFLGAVMSAFVGALVMTPVAAYVARRDTGPATQVSFLPAFWLLVPGALGLVGVTKLLGDDRANALSALATTATTMIAISFGVLIGRAVVGALPRGLAPHQPVEPHEP